MSKEKQIDEMARSLNETTFRVNVYTLADHLHPETIHKVAEYLYNAGYRKQGEWISVDERLPKQRKLVLCIWTLENGCLNNYGFARYQGENVWYVSNEGIHKVTHWMPLPEPPKMERR